MEDVMYCRNCGKEVPPGSEFCSSCGARPQAGHSYCAGCGSQTGAMDETCAKCGAPLQKAAAVKAAACSPKATSAYSFAWKALWPSFWMLLAIGLVVMVIDGAVGAISNYVVPLSA